ncbi:DUF2293 domain-containing protein [Rhizobium sp. LjRoot254]|uniref:DUF2293 domain-containing protein n=1 Tax=Rhizobium sp. LjRoot254 TaxID=3342297 RepID=UPI003ECE85E2
MPNYGTRYVKFTEAAVRRHLHRHHPGCPEFAVDYVVAQIVGREWQGVSLGGATGIILQTLLRHLMTDYDQLLLAGVDRKAARKRVQPKIDAMLSHWSRSPTSD